MKKRFFLTSSRTALTSITLLGSLFLPLAAQAQTSTGGIISYQGQLSDNAGKPVPNGTQSLTFKIYEDGAEVSSQTMSVATIGGVFNTFLSVGALSFDPAKSYELGITYNGVESKHPIAAVPVAVNAKKAESAASADSVVGATALNTPDTVVKRDTDGNLAAGTITASGLSFGTDTVQTTPYDPTKVVQLAPSARQDVASDLPAINFRYSTGTNPTYFARFGLNFANISGIQFSRTEQIGLRADGGILARGELGYGNIPMSGAGTRMMWYPFKAAFRAGQIEGGANGPTDMWDDNNVGFFSLATGSNTKASALGSVALGTSSTASSNASVALGNQSTASGLYAVAMGSQSTASNTNALAIGDQNTADSRYSIALGAYNTASGDASIALGRNAQATHDYSFVVGLPTNSVFSSAASTTSTTSDRNGQFKVRAPGGVTFLSNNTTTAVGIELSPGAGTWSTLSDRNAKKGFAPINTREVLRKVNALPLSSWQYKENPSRHIGPMAQDFRAAFGLGMDERHIDSVDMDGVALAAIQGLNAEIKDRDAKIQELEAKNSAMEARLNKLESALKSR